MTALGFSQETAVLIFLFAIAGSFFNIPLGKRKIVLVERPYFFGLFKKSFMALEGVSINVGGAVIPIILAFYFLSQIPLRPALLATFFMVIVSHIFSKVVPGKGVVVSPFLVAVMALVLAFIIAPSHVAPLAFVSGVFGVLLGADILNIRRVLGQGEGAILCIGGAGVFDGIFLIGIISALFSGL